MSVGGQQDGCILDNRKKTSLWYRRSLRGTRQQASGSLTRTCKPKLTPSNSLVDYSDPQRTTIQLEKQDNETFGFEIQTYGLQLSSSSAVEMCTFVCTVQTESVAEAAGLTAGDVIISINRVSIEGSSHQRVLELIRESTNNLRMETVCGSVVKLIELEKKMNLLKRSLREKLLELQTLMLQEQRLTGGNLNDSSLHLSLDSPGLLSSPRTRLGRRFSSDSSCRSNVTDDSDQASVFGDPGSPLSAADDRCFFSREFRTQHRALGRSASSGPAGSGGSLGSLRSLASPRSLGSPGSPGSSSWDDTRTSSLFGTLPRPKTRTRTSVRKHFFKLIPGLQRSVEEEDSGLNCCD